MLGLTIARTKTLDARIALQVKSFLSALSPPTSWFRIQEPFTGAWQRNQELELETLLNDSVVYACLTQIANDVSKMDVFLRREVEDGIWERADNPAWSPVLREPNSYQTREQFFKWWVTSKLVHGSAIVLKRRDGRQVVDRMDILDPMKVRVLEAPDGSAFYDVTPDPLRGVTEHTVYPAREIIYDVMNPLFHPLVGISPLYACAMAALQALKIQRNSTAFFGNGARPGGILMVPTQINQDQADRLLERFETGHSGDNYGKTALLTEGMKYEIPTTQTALESQVVEQLREMAEQVCRAFHMPRYKVQVGPDPTYNNIEALQVDYHVGCIHTHVEGIESGLNKGLGLPDDYEVHFDTDDLFRMDTATLIKSEKEAEGLKTVNESRKRLNLISVDGGQTVYRQQQDFSIEALNRRDQAPAPSTVAAPAAESEEMATKALLAFNARLQTHMRATAQRHAEAPRA